MRATTMYFGAALHTPRGGQCPSLLRLKEGTEGREDWREQGGRGGGKGRFAVERETGRQGGGHRRGVEKNEQTSSERWRGRAAEERTLSSLSFSSLALVSLFLSLSSLSLSFLSLFLSGRHSFSTVPRFRFTMHRRLQRRASYFSSDFLLTSKHEARPREVFFLLPFLPLFLRETYFENAHVYNKGSLRSMR